MKTHTWLRAVESARLIISEENKALFAELWQLSLLILLKDIFTLF